jgi:hypothetical protein
MAASFTTLAAEPEALPDAPQVGGLSPPREKLAAMAFKVQFSGQAQPQDFSDDDGFEFLDGGVLAIHFGDEETWAQYHPPSKWDQVTADPEHLAGLNTPYVDDEDYEDEDYDEDDEEYEDEDYEDDEDPTDEDATDEA